MARSGRRVCGRARTRAGRGARSSLHQIRRGMNRSRFRVHCRGRRLDSDGRHGWRNQRQRVAVGLDRLVGGRDGQVGCGPRRAGFGHRRRGCRTDDRRSRRRMSSGRARGCGRSIDSKRLGGGRRLDSDGRNWWRSQRQRRLFRRDGRIEGRDREVRRQPTWFGAMQSRGQAGPDERGRGATGCAFACRRAGNGGRRLSCGRPAGGGAGAAVHLPDARQRWRWGPSLRLPDALQRSAPCRLCRMLDGGDSLHRVRRRLRRRKGSRR